MVSRGCFLIESSITLQGNYIQATNRVVMERHESRLSNHRVLLMKPQWPRSGTPIGDSELFSDVVKRLLQEGTASSVMPSGSRPEVGGSR